MFKVFISSTFKDLKNERKSVRDTINNIVETVGMESFIPSEKHPHNKCIEELKKSDIYLLLIGNSYGTIIEKCKIGEKPSSYCNKCNGKISFTHCEYKHAISSNMPRMALILKENKIRKSIPHCANLIDFIKEIKKTETIKPIPLENEKDIIKLNNSIESFLPYNIEQWVFEKKLSLKEFYGRIDLLKKISKIFENNNVIGLYGVGGIGKTCLIQAFLLLKLFYSKNIYSLEKDIQRYGNIGYNQAKKYFKKFEGKKYFENSYKNLNLQSVFEVLDIKGNFTELKRDYSRDTVEKLIYDELEDKAIILFIDDFHEAEEDLIDFISRYNNSFEKSHIILASREDFSFTPDFILRLEGIKEDYSEFVVNLTKKYGVNEYIGNKIELWIKKIFNITKGHPLATILIIRNCRYLNFEELDKFDNIYNNVKDQNQLNDLISRLIEEILTEKEKEALSFLSIYRKDFGSSSIADFTNNQNEFLRSLISKDMIKKVMDKYQFSNDLIKQIFQIKLTNHYSRTSAHRKAAKYYLNYLGEKPNETIECIYHIIQSGDWRLGYNQFSENLEFLTNEGQWNEIVEICNLLLQYISSKDYILYCFLLAIRAVRLREFGEYDKSMKDCEDGIKISREHKNLDLEAEFLHEMAMIYKYLGNTKKALQLYNESYVIRKKTRNKRAITDTLFEIATILHQQGDPKALEMHLEDLKLERELDNQDGIARSLIEIGAILIGREEYDDARKYLNEALTIAKKQKNLNLIGGTLHFIAVVQFNYGHIDEAFKKIKESIKIFRQLGDFKDFCSALRSFANFLTILKKYKPAICLLEKSLEVSSIQNDPLGMAESLFNLGEPYIFSGMISEAEDAYNRSFNIAEKIRHKKLQALSLMAVGRIYDKMYEKNEIKKGIKLHRKIDKEYRDVLSPLHIIGNLIELIYLIIKLKNVSAKSEVLKLLSNVDDEFNKINDTELKEKVKILLCKHLKLLAQEFKKIGDNDQYKKLISKSKSLNKKI